MHETLFAQAALPAPARVLGLTLRPYSLGHELWLIREQNVFAVHHREKVSQLQILRHLPAAVLICSQTFDELQAVNTDLLFGLKAWIWRRRVKRMDVKGEVRGFMRYLQEGCLDFPGETPTKTRQSRESGAPYLLRLHDFLMRHLGKSETEAWDYPLGLAQMRYAAFCEQEGCWEIQSEYDLEYAKARDEWMAQNPGSTLKEVTDAV